MTKVDKDNYKKDEKLSIEYNDAHAALRGFANSDLESSLVLSAGMNPRLYSYIEQFDDFFPDESSSSAFKEDTRARKIHHFRFKIDETVSEHASRIDVHWYGYAKNDSFISMYCWQPPSSKIPYVGGWKLLKLRNSDGENISITYSQPDNSNNSYIQYNDYIDVCIVVNPRGGKKCNLFSDYVKVTVYGAYSETGTALTKPIPTKNISSWESFTWKDNEKSETDITYHILYNYIGTQYKKVEENYLEGNENGFSSDTSNPPIAFTSNTFPSAIKSINSSSPRRSIAC